MGDSNGKIGKRPTGETESISVLTDYVDWEYQSDPVPRRPDDRGEFPTASPSAWANWVADKFGDVLKYEIRAEEARVRAGGSDRRLRALQQAQAHVAAWKRT
jgi:hypothetical protein